LVGRRPIDSPDFHLSFSRNQITRGKKKRNHVHATSGRPTASNSGEVQSVPAADGDVDNHLHQDSRAIATTSSAGSARSSGQVRDPRTVNRPSGMCRSGTLDVVVAPDDGGLDRSRDAFLHVGLRILISEQAKQWECGWSQMNSPWPGSCSAGSCLAGT
jgi:hypothetical protein